MAIRILTILDLPLWPAWTIVRIERQATPKFGLGELHIIPIVSIR